MSKNRIKKFLDAEPVKLPSRPPKHRGVPARDRLAVLSVTDQKWVHRRAASLHRTLMQHARDRFKKGRCLKVTTHDLWEMAMALALRELKETKCEACLCGGLGFHDYGQGRIEDCRCCCHDTEDHQ